MKFILNFGVVCEGNVLFLFSDCVVWLLGVWLGVVIWVVVVGWGCLVLLLLMDGCCCFRIVCY